MALGLGFASIWPNYSERAVFACRQKESKAVKRTASGGSSPPSVSVRSGGVATCGVLLVDGVLPHWNQALQAELIDHDARPWHLFLDSLGLTEASSFVTLHKIGGRVAPYRVDNHQDFVEKLCGLGYRLKKRWRNKETDIEIPLAGHLAELAHGMHLQYSGAG